MVDGKKNLALLIDADNIPTKFFKELVAAADALGSLVVKRAYGNPTTWGKAALRTLAQEYTLTPVLVIPPVNAKNAADMRLAIDAVDLLHWQDHLAGICIASSDSDFATLAVRIKEDGVAVYGFGEAKTPDVFVNACTRFTVLGQHAETPRRTAAPAKKPAVAPVARRRAASAAPAAKAPSSALPTDQILAAIADEMEDGWASLADVRNNLGKRIPDFSHRNYGTGKFSDFISKFAELEMDKIKNARGAEVTRVRPKPGSGHAR